MMMKIFSLVLALALTMSCFPTSQDLSDVTPRFQTTESSVPFFRNTRSVFYDFIEKPEASVELFYPGKPTSASSQPGYVWYLAYNRLQSKVMAFHESTPALESDPCDEIQWHWKQPEGAKRKEVLCGSLLLFSTFSRFVKNEKWRRFPTGACDTTTPWREQSEKHQAAALQEQGLKTLGHSGATAG